MNLHQNHEKNKFLYEQRPFIYFVLALICFALGKYSKIGVISGVILVLCGAYILYMRNIYRDTNDKINRLYKKDGTKK